MSRIARLFLLIPLALDCAGCLLLGGSWRNTISGESWNNRANAKWGRRLVCIDDVFGAGHCQAQAEREAEHGSVWRAWYVDF